MCKPIVKEKIDKLSNKTGSKYQFLQKDSTDVDIKPGSKFQEISKDSIKNMDQKIKGGDEVGDVVGENNEGGEAGLTNRSFCNLCSTEVEDFKIHIETNHAIHGGGDQVASVVSEQIKVENESSDDAESCSDEEDINIEYEYTKNVGTFKGNKPTFVHAVKEIKEFIVQAKGSTQIVNKHRFSVNDIKEIEYGLEADVEIFNGKLKGLARINIWGPATNGKGKKKNKCTIMVKRYPGYERKYFNYGGI